MVKNISPCKGCNNRAVGCHGTCGEYLEWSEWNEKRNAEIRQEKNTTHDIREYRYDSYSRNNRSDRR